MLVLQSKDIQLISELDGIYKGIHLQYLLMYTHHKLNSIEKEEYKCLLHLINIHELILPKTNHVKPLNNFYHTCSVPRKIDLTLSL